MTTDTSQSILIIGAGPVGLALAKALGEADIACTQVEATDHVGGNWAHGVYETAHIISSRRTTEYPDFPMPESYPDFPSARQMKDYFNAYADRFGLRERIRFDTSVQRVTPREDRLWDVTFSDGSTSTWKGVACCNGHHWSRSLPEWTKRYESRLIHSKDYRSPDELRGKRVLVLGGGNSGCDVASEAARVGASAEWSLRRGYWFMPKTFFGTPSVEFMNPWLPVPAQRLVLRGLIRTVVGRYERYGLPTPDHKLFEAHPTVSTEVFHYLKHGRLAVRPDVADVRGDELVFSDGTTGRYDLVVCATGYDVSFPFLPDGLVRIDGKAPRLYGGVMTRDHRHLYIVGAFQPRYGLGPLVRPMSVLLARWIRLQDELTQPLGRVFEALGVPPTKTHLVDPHAALRQMKVAMRLDPVLRWKDRRL